MATSFGSLCDDFYVNMNLNTELELPTERDTILHFFERIQRQFPAMNTFYQRESGEFCLDEDREAGSYRWVSVERDRVCSGHVNPDSLDQADQQHRLILELVPMVAIPYTHYGFQIFSNLIVVLSPFCLSFQAS